MDIDQIATRFIDRSDTSPGDVTIDDTYRQRWWLPIIGPTATCILNHLAASDDDTSRWEVTPTHELAFALGLGKGTGSKAVLTTRETASVLRVSEKSVREGIKEGSIPCIRLGRRLLVPVPMLLSSLLRGPTSTELHE